MTMGQQIRFGSDDIKTMLALFQECSHELQILHQAIESFMMDWIIRSQAETADYDHVVDLAELEPLLHEYSAAIGSAGVSLESILLTCARARPIAPTAPAPSASAAPAGPKRFRFFSDVEESIHFSPEVSTQARAFLAANAPK